MLMIAYFLYAYYCCWRIHKRRILLKNWTARTGKWNIVIGRTIIVSYYWWNCFEFMITCKHFEIYIKYHITTFNRFSITFFSCIANIFIVVFNRYNILLNTDIHYLRLKSGCIKKWTQIYFTIINLLAKLDFNMIFDILFVTFLF